MSHCILQYITWHVSGKQITATLIKVFAETYKAFSQDLLRGCGYDERIADIPMKVC